MKTRFFLYLCGILFLAVLGRGLRSQADPLRLDIARTNANVVITWTNTGALLETSDGLPGTWSVVTGAVSPRVIVPTNPMSFFRLQATTNATSFDFRYVAPTFTASIGNPIGDGSVSPETPNSLWASAPIWNHQDTGRDSVLLPTGESTQDAVALEVPGRGFNW